MTLAQLLVQLTDAEELVRYLARTYGDNDPIFALSDQMGRPLEANMRLAATWQRIVRNPVVVGDTESNDLGDHGGSEEREEEQADGIN